MKLSIKLIFRIFWMFYGIEKERKANSNRLNHRKNHAKKLWLHLWDISYIIIRWNSRWRLCRRIIVIVYSANFAKNSKHLCYLTSLPAIVLNGKLNRINKWSTKMIKNWIKKKKKNVNHTEYYQKKKLSQLLIKLEKQSENFSRVSNPQLILVI